MVSWLFLFVCCIGAAFTINAFRPARRNAVLFAPSFFASWLTIELGWIHILWEGVATVVFVAFGALDRPAGWVGLAIAVLNWIALGVIALRGWATAGLAEVALSDLGDGATAIERPKHRVAKTTDIPFRRVAGKVVKLDVWQPADPPAHGERRPALLQVHGGGWVIGDKREQGRPLMSFMAKRGWVCFNPNYRLSPGATWPDHLTDLKHAVAYIREHADEYGIDPDFLVVTGGSAGGHLAAMLALTANDPRYQEGFEDVDTSFDAAVPFYGVYDFTNRNDTMPPQFLPWIIQPMVMKEFLADDPQAFADASPLDLVRADAPPFFVLHGDYDTLAPVQDAREFVSRLSAVSEAPVFYLEMHGAQHAFDVFGSLRTRRAIRAVYRFLTVIHQRYLAGQAPHEMQPSPAEVGGDDGEVVRVDRPDDVERAVG